MYRLVGANSRRLSVSRLQGTNRSGIEGGGSRSDRSRPRGYEEGCAGSQGRVRAGRQTLVAGHAATSVGGRALKRGEGGLRPLSLRSEIAMWILFKRAPRPDAPYWPGRNWLAALDAVAWPAAWALGVTHAPIPTGIVGILVIACAALSAASRLQQALLRNERYRFTTWRWGKLVVGLLLLGWILKSMTAA